MESVKKFKTAINRTFAETGGVLWQGITDRQLSTYIMDILREYSQSSNAKRFHGALVIGRQPNFRKVDADGEFIDCPNDEPGIEVDGCNRKKDDFETSVYIFSGEVQVC